MKLTRLGHSCFVFELADGHRIMADPFLGENPACPKSFLEDDYLKTIDTVLLTHGHFDHASGLSDLQRINPNVLVVAQYEFALTLMEKGFSVFPLNFGGSYSIDGFRVTMVQAAHTSTFGETEGSPLFAGLPCGFILEAESEETVYLSGDTTVMADMKIIQDIYNPKTAILSSSGQFVMGPREAAYAVKNLLNVKTVIPCHTFPKPEEAADPARMKALISAFPVVENMTGRDEELKYLLKDESTVDVKILDYGETSEI
ncbi:metal-dependent hydrolase [Alteribacter natronophilus]|uniref:metal-dependent hydrolase n=1 Tax=Alteribacter natronophilus TaxID=2583810 RepID=UPI00110D398C|nr:metal-dependent hydrolase [Alteribacter natronophilus]TMW73415.1 metal-dependent hydrolase [Alteribacter natronophilus]